MTNRFLLIALTFLLLTGCNKGTSTKNPEKQVDSITNILEEIVKNWDPEKEPWRYTEFEIQQANLTVKYGQQAIHPFLAEYVRTIQFSSKEHTSEVFDMTINTGGRTLIKVYFDSTHNIIVMEDSFGGYYFDLNTKEYSEKTWGDFKPYKNEKMLIGHINGKQELKFERIE
jgi:hypothetical protein